MQIDNDGKFEYSQEVEVAISQMPQKFALMQNYPNPFNPTTTIGFMLPVSGFTSLRVYDILGREVATLFADEQKAGLHSVRFDASKLTSGVYFYRLNAGEFTASKKFLLLK